MRSVIKILKYLSFIFSALFIFIIHFSEAEESIEYVAEHLLEAPMDTRALAFPVAPANILASEARLQLGYSSFDAGKLHNKVPTLGAHYFLPLNERWGFLAEGFYDSYTFSGEKGKAVGQVLMVNAPNVPDKFAVDITNVSGSGKYLANKLRVAFSIRLCATCKGPSCSPS